MDKLNGEEKKILEKIAGTIRGLSMDAVQKADSGHPGLPLGCAELGAYLYGKQLKYNPKNPYWKNRDRFVLSAGHGSMLLYSCLHLSGFPLTLEDLKDFRQLHSKTPGHPESLDTVGVETTTGPLGQGVANAVGMALGLKMLAAKFNTEKTTLFNPKVYALMGDGCVMEGVSSEASSFAGHLQLDNLVLIYDSNAVCLDGPLSEALSENTKMRYEAYGFQVFEINGNDLEEIHQVFSAINAHQDKPILVIAKTIIGKGSPHKEGTSKAHGAPLGEEEVKLTKENLGLPLEPFFVPQEVKEFFKVKIQKEEAAEEKWKRVFEEWAKENTDKKVLFDQMSNLEIPSNLEEILNKIAIKTPAGGRKSSEEVIQVLANDIPSLIGGSADLSCSDLTYIKAFPAISKGHFNGRNIKYGVREFAMAAIATGISQTEMFLPFVGTFLTFSDYMRNAVRLASLMKRRVIYQFTHDSIFLGEDGPTHQPVEQVMSLRLIPNLIVIRPCDAKEVKMAWKAALEEKGPTALILSRQNLKELPETDVSFEKGLGKGAYIIKKERGSKPDYTLMASGSEVALALEVASALESTGKSVRVISFPCFELFDRQPKNYRDTVLGGDIGLAISIEAGATMGWQKYIGKEGLAIGVDTFGASAPYKDLLETFGFTVESILERIRTHI